MRAGTKSGSRYYYNTGISFVLFFKRTVTVKTQFKTFIQLIMILINLSALLQVAMQSSVDLHLMSRSAHVLKLPKCSFLKKIWLNQG